MYSNELTEKIDPNKGVNIIFKDSYGRECITLPRSEWNLHVGAKVTTWVGALNAKHFYASFTVGPLVYRYMDENNGYMSSTCQPKDSEGIRIDVCVPAKENIYGYNIFEKSILEVSKGLPTIRFENIEDVIEAIEMEFERLFGDPWELKESCTTNSWKEYKRELLEDYGKNLMTEMI